MNSGSYYAHAPATLRLRNLARRHHRLAHRRSAPAASRRLRGTFVLFAVSFPLMAWLVRRLCTGAQLPPEQFLAGAVSVALPTLLLDPFSCVYFPALYPNMAPQVAGVFGGWLLWCCAGAIVGALIPPWRKT